MILEIREMSYMTETYDQIEYINILPYKGV